MPIKSSLVITKRHLYLHEHNFHQIHNLAHIILSIQISNLENPKTIIVS